MAEASAWLLTLDGGLQVAVGEQEMVHLVQLPPVFEIVDVPAYCRYVLLWQGDVVPVLDLAAWASGRPATPTSTITGIFAYQTKDAIAYGALPLLTVPARRRVRDEQACALPDQPVDGWARIALSCFSESDKQVPILDLRRLFSGALL